MEAPIYHLEGVVKARAEEELGDFTGPLDLILHLLSKNRMEIKDIQIAVILDQYMAWMNQRKHWIWKWPATLCLWLPNWSLSSPGCCCPSTTRRPSARWSSSSLLWRRTSAMRTI